MVKEPIKENIIEKIKDIGKTIIDRAEETGENVDGVKSISIYATINPGEFSTVDITKQYIAGFEKEGVV
ncbi:MAG: hypothetical protein HFJ55_05585 [Clostridia bacterium]|nr:hypothetical protein [Clostridia bacterium]